MSAPDFSDVRAISECFELALRFKQVEGWLSPLEGYLLMKLAREGEGKGAIVEIGSWMGRSTSWLAAGTKAAGREQVHAVDTFDGGPHLRDRPVIRDEGTTYHRFAENLERLGLFDMVTPIMADSLSAARQWSGAPIRLLFIDGDHTYEAVKADFEAWSKFVIPGGYVVLDDVAPGYPGVVQLYREVLARGGYEEVIGVAKVRVLRKRAAA